MNGQIGIYHSCLVTYDFNRRKEEWFLKKEE